MYTAKGYVILKDKRRREGEPVQVLKATFRFDEEIARNIKGLSKNGFMDYISLYLNEKYGLQERRYNKSRFNYSFFTPSGNDKIIDVKIRPFIWRHGFNLTATSPNRMPLEEMIDLEALNKLVLTGEGIRQSTKQPHRCGVA